MVARRVRRRIHRARRRRVGAILRRIHRARRRRVGAILRRARRARAGKSARRGSDSLTGIHRLF